MLNIDSKKKSGEIIAWIKKTIHNSDFKKTVIGLSGGIDSALVAALTVHALGKENVYVFLMPYGFLGKEHVNDAKLVADWLQIPKENQVTIDIKGAVDTISSDSNALMLGNIMARVRMIYLFDFAKRNSALVIGTENKTENYLGYFTRFGDSASDLEPIQSLYKTQVREMAQYLMLPEIIINKSPTAGLWENQTDEGEFGFTYKDADRVLYYSFDEKLNIEDIVKKGIVRETIEKVLERVKNQEFKHKLPYLFDA